MAGKRSTSFEDTRIELLKDDQSAAIYLQECWADGNIELFNAALQDVAKARAGGMTALSEATDMSRTSLYKSLSENGNPSFETIIKVLSSLGMSIQITPKEDKVPQGV